MNFSEFLEVPKDPRRINFSSWVYHPGFKGLYLRYGRKVVDQEIVFPVLTIATVETIEKGKGTFKKFIEFLRTDHHTLHLYVENAHLQFGEGLVRMGFRRIEDSSMHEIASNYFMSAGSDGEPTGSIQISADTRRLDQLSERTEPSGEIQSPRKG